MERAVVGGAGECAGAARGEYNVAEPDGATVRGEAAGEDANCIGHVLVQQIQDYAVYIVAGSANQLAVLDQLPSVVIVVENDWTQPLTPELATVVNNLLAADGLEPVAEGISLTATLTTVLGEFRPELYAVANGEEIA